MNKAGGSDSKNTLHCTFCGKSQHEVRKLIAGSTVFICDEFSTSTSPSDNSIARRHAAIPFQSFVSKPPTAHMGV